MSFTSVDFALFFTIVFLLYWLLPSRTRPVFLLLVSTVFYMSCGLRFVLLLFCFTALAFCLGRLLERTQDACRKKRWFAVSVLLLLLPLFVFKYLDFFSDTLSGFALLFGIRLHPTTLRLVQPLGISFYTFQNLGYIIDVYRGELKAERSFIRYCLFSAFFPQLMSGPIGRGGQLLPQFHKLPEFDYDSASLGLRRIVWGCFKKMVIADNLAVYVNTVYGSPQDFAGLPLLLAVLFFSMEIYCDFSGYTDIARGCAGMLGIRLGENFRSPYFSASIREFWSRWHISLSTWFRDYVYIPLGGNRVGKLRHCLNLLLTFLVSGLWHGANWTFIAWGALHGLAQIAEKLFGGAKKSGHRQILRRLFVFVFVSFAWIFFRADSLRDAVYVITHLFVGLRSPLIYLQTGLTALHENLSVGMKVLAFSIAVLAAFDFASLRTDVFLRLGRCKKPVRYAVYLFIGLFVLLFHYHGDVSFIYSQF